MGVGGLGVGMELLINFYNYHGHSGLFNQNKNFVWKNGQVLAALAGLKSSNLNALFNQIQGVQ